MKHKQLIIISGPTASGKTSLAISVAKQFQTEIISADSRQIYKELNIGVALPSNQELQEVKHHFIHSHSIFSPLNAYAYAEEVILLVNDLFKKHDILIMAGGSGLFLKAVYFGIDKFPDPPESLRESLNNLRNKNYEKMVEWLKQLDPEYYETVDLKNPTRVQRALEVCLTSGKKFSNLRLNQPKSHHFNFTKFAIQIPREDLFLRISSRLETMRKEGLTKEAAELYKFRHLTPLKSIGYQELFDFLDNRISEDEAYQKILTNTKRYAKKQETWLKKESEFIFLQPEQADQVRNNQHNILDYALNI